MDSRRLFIGKLTGGIAGTLAAPGASAGAGDRLRVGLIGAGERGRQLCREAEACGAECVVAADVYRARRERFAAGAPGRTACSDFRRLLEDTTLDAVLIATPQHLHADHFIAAVEAGRHVYLERAAALTLADAKRMKNAAARAGDLVVQVGHQHCSSGAMADARRFLDAGWLGRITAIRAHRYHNTPHGRPPWRRPVLPDMTPENIAWAGFLGTAQARAFDAERFVNWRCFADYSGGAVHEAMSQQLAFWYKALGLSIPRAVTMTGGVCLWKDGRETPDTMNVAMHHDDGLLFTWDSGFGNGQLGCGEYVLGADGTIVRGQQVRYVPEKVNRPGGRETLGRTRSEARAHMREFLEAVRAGGATSCPLELGHRVSVACAMAVESYTKGRTVRWDAEREEVV